MNVSPILRIVHQARNIVIPKMIPMELLTSVANCKMQNVFSKQYTTMLSSTCTNKINSSALLQPYIPIHNSVCGLKMKVSLQLRCRDCYFVWKKERKYVMCKTHPRHKQVERAKKEYNTWILTHASQSRKRQW